MSAPVYLTFAATVWIELPVRQTIPAVATLMIKMIAIPKAQQSHIVRRRELAGPPIFFRSDIGRPHDPEPRMAMAKIDGIMLVPDLLASDPTPPGTPSWPRPD